MLVWQDMPSGEAAAQWDPFGKFDGQELNRSSESSTIFHVELESMVKSLRCFSVNCGLGSF